VKIYADNHIEKLMRNLIIALDNVKFNIGLWYFLNYGWSGVIQWIIKIPDQPWSHKYTKPQQNVPF
jgi:hypothetical protein